MDIQTALKIKEAFLTLSKFTGVDAQQIANRISLFDNELMAKFKQASKVWNEFDDASIEQRAAMLGITLHKITTNDEKEVLSHRLHQLIDKGFAAPLSENELTEKKSICEKLDKLDAPFYKDIIGTLTEINNELKKETNNEEE